MTATKFFEIWKRKYHRFGCFSWLRNSKGLKLKKIHKKVGNKTPIAWLLGKE
jgi:hypothetical protein